MIKGFFGLGPSACITMFQVIRDQLFHWIAAHMAQANMCISVYSASQTDDSIVSRCWLKPVRSNDTMVWSNLCFLDARHFPILPEFIGQIKQVQSSADNEAVIFLLKLPEKHVKLWRDVLTRSFSEQQGYRNVMQYYAEDAQLASSGRLTCFASIRRISTL